MPGIVKQIFPELGWERLTPAAHHQLLTSLDAFTPYGPPAAAYLREHATGLGYFSQTGNAAAWTLFNNLILHADTDLNHPRTMALLIHEVLHLQQPFTLRLSIQGELAAWQLEYRIYGEATGVFYGEAGAPFAGKKAHWQALSRLSSASRTDLAHAQRLMKEISPPYRAQMLPLYPLGREIFYRVTHAFKTKEKNG